MQSNENKKKISQSHNIAVILRQYCYNNINNIAAIFSAVRIVGNIYDRRVRLGRAESDGG